ncbi:molecular chaperone DnaJ [Chloroflexus islandicus]|uniref:Molecular chaperone DnaJ n=1 Tax=Chloroflexus islandicus TaxID=1707952 RepID=A0A178M3J6_9CHLR|nr:J domain-containing protein [Chloroflexus islandicus]OAN42831.1 molecular chaperone DnaJ [Chloroflexus islandicus]
MNDDFDQLDDYAILGIRPGAAPADIKQAYLKQISLYHPDRYAGASPAEQEYAARRARRINQAYQNLRRRRPSAPVTPVQRDYQAELYAQAQAHLAAGRRLQALATLRELQRINPWYRDCATLIAELEAEYQTPAPAGGPTISRRTLLTAAVGGLTLALLGWYGWRQLQGAMTAQELEHVPAAAPSPTAAPSAAPSPTAGPAATPSPTAAPAAAPSPTAAPAAAPSPTAAPATTPSPTAAPTTAPSPTTIAAGGPVVYQADFGPNSDWPTTSGNGWSVSASNGAYRIQANAGLGDIWAFRTSPIGADMVIEVEASVIGDWGGLMLRFNGPQRYLSFAINPASGQFRCDERNGDQRTLLAEGAFTFTERTRLSARLEGQSIELRINDQVVSIVTSATPPPDARYGLLARAERNATTATFSNLVIRALR